MARTLIGRRLLGFLCALFVPFVVLAEDVAERVLEVQPGVGFLVFLLVSERLVAERFVAANSSSFSLTAGTSLRLRARQTRFERRALTTSLRPLRGLAPLATLVLRERRTTTAARPLRRSRNDLPLAPTETTVPVNSRTLVLLPLPAVAGAGRARRATTASAAAGVRKFMPGESALMPLYLAR